MSLLPLAWASLVLLGDVLPHERVEGERLMVDLRALPSHRAARGSVEAQHGLARTEEFILDRLIALGYEPRRQPLTWNLAREEEARARGVPARPAWEFDEELARRTWHNILVDLPGQGPEARDVLIVSSHFDAVAGSPGADDNGTGTVALLEIARVLHGRPTRRSVRLVFFNLEEIGLKGSIEYVRTLKPRLDAGEERVVGMVSLEMLGYFTDEPGSQRSPIPSIPGVFEPPTVGDFIALATTRSHAPFLRRLEAEMRRSAPGLKTVAPDFVPDLPLCPPDFLRSDHAPFLALGIPAVMLTDTSNFRNPHYHRPTDTPATIDAERFAQVVRGVVGAIYAIAEAAVEP